MGVFAESKAYAEDTCASGGIAKLLIIIAINDVLNTAATGKFHNFGPSCAHTTQMPIS